jgi:hypothetical protein
MNLPSQAKPKLIEGLLEVYIILILNRKIEDESDTDDIALKHDS